MCMHVLTALFCAPLSSRSFAIKYKDRVNMKEILPAVAWKDAGSATGKTLKSKTAR